MLTTLLCWLIGGLAIGVGALVLAVVALDQRGDPGPFLRDCDRLLGRRE